MTLDQLHNDPVVYTIACCALALCVWIFGYWVGVGRGRYLERQIRETTIEFHADSISVSSRGNTPIITPLRTVRAANANPDAYTDFGSN